MSTATIDTVTHAESAFDLDRQRELTRRAIAKHSFCTIGTSSAANLPHVVGMRYALIGNSLYLTMYDESVKARNIRQNPHVALCIPVRSFPFFPPFAVQFQATAELLPGADGRIVELFEAGRLKGIISRADFANPHTSFARIALPKRVSTFGIGVSLLQIAREPSSAIRGFAL